MTTSGSQGSGAPPQFQHAAVLYAGPEQFVAACGPFVRAGVDAGEPVLVATDPAKLDMLRSAVGPAADKVRWEDMTSFGRNPGRIIPVWREFIDDHADAPSLRGIGEPVWPGRTPVELAECEQHESLLNVAFEGGQPWQLWCPYDTSVLPQAALDGCRRTHPLVGDGAGFEDSEVYGRIEGALREFASALPPAPSGAPVLRFDAAALTELRRKVAEQAGAAGLAGERAEDLVLAVNELATNSLAHGGGAGQLRMWTDAGSLVCEIRDAGRIADPLVGRQPPALDEASGRGLWLAHQLCDLVQVRSNDHGTVVRAHMDRVSASV